MGAYESPTPIVDRSSGQNLAALQGTIAKSFAMSMQGYQARQKEIRFKKEKEDLRVDKLIKKGADDVTLMQRSVARTAANKNNKIREVDWAKFYEGDIREYEQLVEGLALGTSKNPGADKRRMNEIFGQVTNLTDSLGYISATTTIINKSLNGNTANKPGGIYTGEQANTIEAFSIFDGQMPGSRQPRKQDGQLVWDIFDGEGKLVETIDTALLQRLSDQDQSVVTTISDPNGNGEWNKQVINNGGNFFQITGTKDDGTPEYSTKVNSAGLNPEYLTPTKLAYTRKSDGSTTSVQMFESNYDKMMQNTKFAVNSEATVEGMFVTNKNRKSALGYANTQMQNIELTEENFINNPLFKGKYTKENLKEGDPIGGEVFAMINDSDNSGDYMFDLESNLTDEQKDIFNIMYQKHWLKNNVQADNIASSTLNSVTETQYNLNTFKDTLEKTYAKDPKYRIEKGKGRIDAGLVLTDMLNNDQVNNEALKDFIVVTQDVIDDQTDAFEADYLADLAETKDVRLGPTGQPILDKGDDNGPQRKEMEKQKEKYVKDLTKAINEGSIYDTKTDSVLTYDMMNAKIQKFQKEVLNDRTDPSVTPPITSTQPSVVETSVVETPVVKNSDVITSPNNTNDGYGDTPWSDRKLNPKEKREIQLELNPKWQKFRKQNKKKNTFVEFEKWFDSGRPKTLGTNDRGEEFDIS